MWRRFSIFLSALREAFARSTDARAILANGADKISINSPALENPEFIDRMAAEFGSQCVVVGIDSREEAGDYWVYQYTGDEKKTVASKRRALEWVTEAARRGAGEVVLNCMNQDGVRKGYDVKQLGQVREKLSIPLIASGGAGAVEHFADVFLTAHVDGALAASVFHKQVMDDWRGQRVFTQERRSGAVMTKTFDLDTVAWDKSDGLVPAVVQDAHSLRVLMLGLYESRGVAGDVGERTGHIF